jgi:integrase
MSGACQVAGYKDLRERPGTALGVLAIPVGLHSSSSAWTVGPMSRRRRTSDPGLVQGYFRRAARKASLYNNGPHMSRQTFCSHLAMHGATARAIQELAGDRDLSTTQRYMHLSPAALDSAIRLLDCPGVLPRFGDGDGAGAIRELEYLEVVR